MRGTATKQTHVGYISSCCCHVPVLNNEYLLKRQRMTQCFVMVKLKIYQKKLIVVTTSCLDYNNGLFVYSCTNFVRILQKKTEISKCASGEIQMVRSHKC